MKALLLVLFTALSIFSRGQTNIYALVGDENDNCSVNGYNYSTNVLSNSFPVPNCFYPEGSTFNSSENKIIFATDNGITSIDVSTGDIQNQPFPFPATNGFGLCLKYHPLQQIVYAMTADENDNFSLSVYDHSSNTLSSTFSMTDGFNADGSTFDYNNNKIIYQTDFGISYIDVTTGGVVANNFPFAATGGYQLSMFYDGDVDKVYALIEDNTGTLSVAEYDYASNTLSNSIALGGSFPGIYIDGPTYDSQNNKIVGAYDNGIVVLDPTTGAYTVNTPLPFAGTLGFSLALHYDLSQVVSIDETIGNDTKVTLYPNPAQETVTIDSDQSISNIDLVDLSGKHIFSSATKSINVEALESGVYIVQIQFENGATTFERFVKQ